MFESAIVGEGGNSEIQILFSASEDPLPGAPTPQHLQPLHSSYGAATVHGPFCQPGLSVSRCTGP